MARARTSGRVRLCKKGRDTASSVYMTIRILPVLLMAFMLASSAHAAAPQRDLTVGSHGDDVVKLQDFLITEDSGSAARALAAAGATGNFGQLTRAAVIEFQKAKGIAPAYGYVGIKTRSAMSAKPMAEPVLTGTLDAIDTACFADGVCSATIDGKTVVLMSGFRMPPVPPLGRLIGADSIGDLEGMIGAHARLYAATGSDEAYDYTLYGSKDYYLEVVPAVPAEGRITVRGTVGCLPAKDPSQPTIKLCAFGLKGADGNYYQLSDPRSRFDFVSYEQDAQLLVSGTFTKGEHETWKSVGTIEVRKVVEAK